MEKMYDLIVLGAGPAGLSTGVYAGRAKMRTLIIEKGNGGGQTATTSEIANYPGIRMISGSDLVKEMRLQAEDFGVEFLKSEVVDVDFSEDVKVVKTNAGEFKAVSVVIATGASPRTLGFPGEAEFTGRGVAYCSTCDGEFFSGLEVFVIGAGYAAAEEAIYLTRFAKKITVIAREPEFTCAKSIADKVLAHPQIEVKFNSEILEATGDGMLQHAKFRNNETGETWEYDVNPEDGSFGIFVFVGYQPKTDLVRGHVEMDRWGYILTNDTMRTNVEGVYAAGDLRPKSLRQVVTAVADGAVAATDAEKYVSETKERLGIEIAPAAPKKEEKKETPKANTTNSGKSSLLNDGMRDQLRGVFARMEKDVTMVTVVDPTNAKSIELQTFLEDVVLLGEKLHLEVYTKGANAEVESKVNSDKYPMVALLNADGSYSGVKFHGVPGGHELNSFILAIYNLAGPGQAVDATVLTDIKALSTKTNLKVMVSLSCHYCPDVVVGAQRIAIENENVEAEMVDIANFPEIKTKYKVMSVPAIIVNDERVIFGAKKIEEIVAEIAN